MITYNTKDEMKQAFVDSIHFVEDSHIDISTCKKCDGKKVIHYPQKDIDVDGQIIETTPYDVKCYACSNEGYIITEKDIDPDIEIENEKWLQSLSINENSYGYGS